MKADMAAQGRQQKDVDAVQPLFCAVQKKVFSAILRPTVRTQYQRCAFQIPFDATVRVSLDTNLRMYKELPDEENPLWSWDMGLLTPRPAHDHAPGTNLSRSSANGTRAGAARGTTRATGVNASELSSESGEDSIEFKAWCAAPQVINYVDLQVVPKQSQQQLKCVSHIRSSHWFPLDQFPSFLLFGELFLGVPDSLGHN